MTKWCFSVTTGEIYKVLEEDLKNLTEEQILLKAKPSSSCKDCYGRLYTGVQKFFDKKEHKWTSAGYKPCMKCLRKYIDRSARK